MVRLYHHWNNTTRDKSIICMCYIQSSYLLGYRPTFHHVAPLIIMFFFQLLVNKLWSCQIESSLALTHHKNQFLKGGRAFYQQSTSAIPKERPSAPFTATPIALATLLIVSLVSYESQWLAKWIQPYYNRRYLPTLIRGTAEADLTRSRNPQAIPYQHTGIQLSRLTRAHKPNRSLTVCGITSAIDIDTGQW